MDVAPASKFLASRLADPQSAQRGQLMIGILKSLVQQTLELFGIQTARADEYRQVAANRRLQKNRHRRVKMIM